MPIYTDGPIGADAPLQDFAPSFGLSLGAAAEDAFVGNPSKVIYDYFKVRGADQGQKLDKAQAQERVKAAGVALKIPDEGYSEDALRMLIERKQDENARKSILARAPAGVLPSTARFTASLMVGVMDPLNLASAWIPVVGEARYAEMLAGAAGAGSRAAVRAGVGAAEGLVGAAVLEPFVYAGRTQLQDDYGMSDSLLNLAFGTVAGGALHAGAGFVGDRLGTSGFARADAVRQVELAQDYSLRAAAAEPDQRITIDGLLAKQDAAVERVRTQLEPTSAAARVAEMTPEGQQAAMKVAVAQAMEGRIPDVSVISTADRDANLRQFMAGSKVVDAQGQPLTVFHGTMAEFDRFDTTAGSTPGSWFTTSSEGAAQFGNVKEVNLSIKNPASIIDLAAARREVAASGLEPGESPRAFNQAVISNLEAKGFDGIHQTDFKGAGGSEVWAAFRQDQIHNVSRGADLPDPISTARDVSERMSRPESVAVADFEASRQADERLSLASKPDAYAQESLDAATTKLDALISNIEARGDRTPQEIAAMREFLAPFDEGIEQAKGLGEGARAAAICGLKP